RRSNKETDLAADNPTLEGVATELAPSDFVSQNYETLVAPMQDEAKSRPRRSQKVDAFARRISDFSEDKKRRMPANVKTYDGTGDPDDHLKIFELSEIHRKRIFKKRTKRKPKASNSKHGVEKGKVKSQQSKKIQLEGPKLPKPQVVLQKRKTRVKIAKKTSLNPAAGGIFLDKRHADCQASSKASPKLFWLSSTSRQADISSPTPAPVKAVGKVVLPAVVPTHIKLPPEAVFHYDGPLNSNSVVEVDETEVTKDTVLPNGTTKDVQPPIVQVDEQLVML
ncbi:hypothetical protein Tco_0946145, partial [Tanacetum coccineum]